MASKIRLCLTCLECVHRLFAVWRAAPFSSNQRHVGVTLQQLLHFCITRKLILPLSHFLLPLSVNIPKSSECLVWQITIKINRRENNIYFHLSRDCSQTLLENKIFVVGWKELSFFIFRNGGAYIKPYEDTGQVVRKIKHFFKLQIHIFFAFTFAHAIIKRRCLCTTVYSKWLVFNNEAIIL